MRRLVGLREMCDQCDRGGLDVGLLRVRWSLMDKRAERKGIHNQLQVMSVVFLTDSLSLGKWAHGWQGCYAVHGRAHGFSARQVC